MLEFILRPILEFVLYVFGYWTGRLVLPLFSAGRVEVAPLFERTKVKPKWHGFQRGAEGRLVADSDTASLIGFVFWAAIGVICYVAFSRDAP